MRRSKPMIIDGISIQIAVAAVVLLCAVALFLAKE
jgi:hypothetical protein